MPIIKNVKEIETTGDGMAAILGITRRWLYELVNTGVIHKSESNKFNVVDSASRYCEYLRSGTTEKKIDTQAQYWNEKTAHEAARKEMASINLGKIKAELLEAKSVELVFGGMMTVFRRTMLSLPRKLAKQLAGKKERDIARKLTEEISQALTELSQYDAAKFSSGEGPIDDTEDD